MAYELRLFFDPGSGTCLWARNESARQKFGYPVDLTELPVTEATKRLLQHLVLWYDTSIDWKNPTDSRWSPEDLKQFTAAVQQVLQALRRELSDSEYRVLDETAA